MIFAAPWLLLALPALPLLWWLLRATPPAPRLQSFPAIRLLADLHATEQTPARTPLWLLALRMAAAALLILGLARPVLDPVRGLPGTGPVLLVIDNGWAAATDWPARIAAADAALRRAGRAHRPVALLATAPAPTGAPPAITAPMPARRAQSRLAALRPLPWPVNRAQAAAALAHWRHPGTAVVYVADGLTDGTGYPAFARRLGAIGPVREFAAPAAPARLLLPPVLHDGTLTARLAITPQPGPTTADVLAQSADGRSLTRAAITIPAGRTLGQAAVDLPLPLRNRLARLTLAGPPGAGSVVLLDARWRQHPVGLVAGTARGAETPLAGPLYFLSRALGPGADIRTGSLADLLKQPLSVLVLADRPLTPGAEQAAVSGFVAHGGLLLRFAGPLTAAHPDPLLPVRLLAQDRRLGGALTWSKPEPLAPFPPNSPFAGLPVPADVTVSRQVLADPARLLPGQVWARLADGTPLVSAARRGAGQIVLVHVTANADWSNLPISGLFVRMLRRIVNISAGVPPRGGTVKLAPAQIMDGFGQLHSPSPAALPIAPAAIDTTLPSPRHPPGLYGPPGARRALNLAAALPPMRTTPPVPGAIVQSLAAVPAERDAGPPLVALGLALLAIDLLAALALRGLLRPALAAILLLVLIPAADAQPAVPAAALHTELAYVVTGNPAIDRVSRQGLTGLSDFVTNRTAAILAKPAGVVPGKDDLSFYPLLYWPVTAGTPAPGNTATAALNSFMSHGGIILIDTEGGDVGSGGSGAGFSPGARAALRRVGRGLDIPPLQPLTAAHVLAHTFYLLRDFPGRFLGARVWVQRGASKGNDGVSPVIVGANDWAAAWAVSADGTHPYATIPGGDRQRVMALRFGVNVVMYALTGTYKGDQVHVPAILERLGQ
ncbi:MAG TPA: DUF4159 domain-containing protein [Acetobacteraceae bacterium]|nr:DUF4159 domain-containing protein [Acetobacteraceae bacterium]